MLGSLAVTALGAALIGALPWLVGATWSSIGTRFASVPPQVILGLLALWMAGVLVHVPVLMAAMPGLSVRQALTLNLAGTAVSNVFPLGGPAGMGLGYAMARSWGFSSDRFASYTVSTNLWNVIGKLILATVVLTIAAACGVSLPIGMGGVVLTASAFVAFAVAAAVLTFRTERATAAVGRRLDQIRSASRRRIQPPGAGSAWLLNCRNELHMAVRRGWVRMTIGVLAYLLLQAALLACLAAVGAGASLTAVAIAFAIERLISLAPITPGSVGVAELGTVAALNSFGVNPVGAAAGVLLYRVLMYAIQIPIGGAIALVWWHRRIRTAATERLAFCPAEREIAPPAAAHRSVLPARRSHQR